MSSIILPPSPNGGNLWNTKRRYFIYFFLR